MIGARRVGVKLEHAAWGVDGAADDAMLDPFRRREAIAGYAAAGLEALALEASVRCERSWLASSLRG